MGGNVEGGGDGDGDGGRSVELDGGGCGGSGVHAATSRPSDSRPAARPALLRERGDPATIPHIMSLGPTGWAGHRRTARRVLGLG